jgi:hypothetical protein
VKRRSRRTWLAFVAGASALLLAIVLGPGLFRTDPPPASAATLEAISERNEKAALEAAAVQRAQSQASALATERALEQAEARGKTGAETAIRNADAVDTARQAGSSD